jgi:hypothetical protein
MYHHAHTNTHKHPQKLSPPRQEKSPQRNVAAAARPTSVSIHPGAMRTEEGNRSSFRTDEGMEPASPKVHVNLYTHTHTHTHYVYIYILSLSLSLSVSLYIYIYIIYTYASFYHVYICISCVCVCVCLCACVCVCVCVCVHVYIPFLKSPLSIHTYIHTHIKHFSKVLYILPLYTKTHYFTDF